MTNSAILNRITRFYLDSGRFSGMPATSLAYRFETTLDAISPYLARLIEEKAAAVLYGDALPNPFIRALPEAPVADQLARLDPPHLEHACIYPLPLHLHRVVDPAQFAGRPYTLKLALGDPQYTFQFFDPGLLDRYLRHRQCRIVHDIQSVLYLPGWSLRFSRASVGPGYGLQFTQVLTANLQQLSLLPPEEQQYWHTMALPGPYTVHPELVRTLVEGRFRERVSIFEALLEEMYAVNALCREMGLPALYLIRTERDRMLRNYGFLPTPTLQSFHQFFLHFQILLLQNMNPAFLEAIEKPPFRPVHARKDRALVRPSKTVLEHVNDWLRVTFARPYEDALDRLSMLIRTTRRDLYERLFYTPARHADHALVQLQRKLMWYAYHALKSIRICFEQFLGAPCPALHPLVHEDRVWVV